MTCPDRDFDEPDYRGLIQLKGRETTATLRQTPENWAKVDLAVSDGRLFATEDELVFGVAMRTERDAEDRPPTKRERVTPLVRPSSEGSGRAGVPAEGFDPRRDAEAA